MSIDFFHKKSRKRRMEVLYFLLLLRINSVSFCRLTEFPFTSDQYSSTFSFCLDLICVYKRSISLSIESLSSVTENVRRSVCRRLF